MASEFNSKAWLAEALPIFTDHKKGVDFVDIDGMTMNPDVYRETLADMSRVIKENNIDHIVLPDARGFLFSALGAMLNLPCQQVRKAGKLPGDVVSMPLVDREYDADNGDILEMRSYDLSGKRVAMIDDVLATGGTALTTAEMVRKLGGEPCLFLGVCEVDGLNGREKLESSGLNVECLLTVSELKDLKKDAGLPVTLTKRAP